jgi:hypothetical protein
MLKCARCYINFAVLEEKILWRGELFHRRCLAKKIAAEKGGEKIIIKDKDLVPVYFQGAYNVYVYKYKNAPK